MVCLELFTVAMLWSLSSCGSGEKIPLRFSYITSKTGIFTASGAIPVVDLALEQINNSTDILPRYTLSYTTILDSQVAKQHWGDSFPDAVTMQCNGTGSLDAFMEHFFRGVSEPTYISLFCCGCSTADISVAEISHYWNVPQVC